MKRDFTYIDDIVDGTISAINHNYQCEVFNLGNNRSEKITEMIEIIEKRLDTKAIINLLPQGMIMNLWEEQALMSCHWMCVDTIALIYYGY